MGTMKEVITDTVFTTAAEKICKQIVDALMSNASVLLLLSGGSAVGVYEEMMKLLPTLSASSYSKITVGLVDERYSADPNHEGSNTVAIEKTGFFDFFRGHGARIETILHGKSMEEEVSVYNEAISHQLLAISIGIFGIGEDGHTAGIFPTAIKEEFTGLYEKNVILNSFQDLKTYEIPKQVRNDGIENFVVGHHEGIPPFADRITITPSCISKLDYAFLVAQGEKKKEPLEKLSKASLDDRYQIPAVILKQSKNLTIVTDQEIPV